MRTHSNRYLLGILLSPPQPHNTQIAVSQSVTRQYGNDLILIRRVHQASYAESGEVREHLGSFRYIQSGMSVSV